MQLARHNSRLLKFEHQYWRGQIDRAGFLTKFLRSGGVTCFGAVDSSDPSSTWITSDFVSGGADATAGSGSSEAHALLSLLFGDLSKSAFNVGTEHYKCSPHPHQDDVFAANALTRILIASEITPRFLGGLYAVSTSDRNVICIGDAQPNLVARMILEYYAPKKKHYLLRRFAEPIFNLPFTPLYDFERYPAHIVPINRLVNGTSYPSRNWCILESSTGKLICPDIEPKSRTLISDLLLITVLPNIFDYKTFRAGRKLVLLGGTHGVGTRAVACLANSPAILREIDRQVRRFDTRCWQALLRISSISRASGTEEPLEIGAPLQVAAVTANDESLSEWFNDLSVAQLGLAKREFSVGGSSFKDLWRRRTSRALDVLRAAPSAIRKTVYLIPSPPVEVATGERAVENTGSRSNRFCFGGYPYEHVVGDRACTSGACGASEGFLANEYPRHCTCGGLIHANACWSQIDDPYWMPYEYCDRCGESCRALSEDVAA